MRVCRTNVKFAVLFSLCVALLLAGCAAVKTFTFNGVSYPSLSSANTALESYYADIEKNFAGVGKRIPASLLIVVPSRAYAREHWVPAEDKRARLGQDQQHFLADIRFREALSAARCLKNSGAFKLVTLVDAMHGTLDIDPIDIMVSTDLVMKKEQSGRWVMGLPPQGPFKPVDVPEGLRGEELIKALIVSAQEQAVILSAGKDLS